MRTPVDNKVRKRAVALGFAAVLAACLSLPSLAFAEVNIDGTVINQGENAVGGGTATLADTVLDMVNVMANSMAITDEKLTVNFNGGNDVECLDIEGSSDVEVNFTGTNEVEDIHAHNTSSVVINADGHNNFEEVEAFENASVVVNLTGENDFETIEGHENANVTVRGMSCQKRDIANVGNDEKESGIFARNGNLRIDHATVNLKSKTARVGSETSNVLIDTSKIASEDGNEYAEIVAGGTMIIAESVIDITGTLHSDGKMTIEHSDVKAKAPDAKYDSSPYRVYSKTDLKLIREDNGEVREGRIDGEEVFYVDTDDNDGREVDLEADGEPGYYKCKDDSSTRTMVPKTSDGANPFALLTICIMSAAAVLFASRRRKTA